MRVVTLVLFAALAATAAAGHAAHSSRIDCRPAAPPGAYDAALDANGDVVVAAPRGASSGLFDIRDGAARLISASWDSPPNAIAVSPDGARLAFVKRTGEIDLDPISGGGIDRVLVPPSPRGESVSLGGWANATTLVYARTTTAADEQGSIYAVDTETAASRKIVNGSEPAVSPDGSRIAFVTGGAFSGSAIETVRSDGTDRRTVVTKSEVADPVWSPDSTRIAFLWTIDVAPTVEVVSTSGGVSTDVGHGDAPMIWVARGIVTHVYQEDAGPAGAVIDPSTRRARRIGHAIRDGSVVPVAATNDVVAYTVGDRDDTTFGVRLVGVDGTHDRALEPCMGTARADRIYGSGLADRIIAGGGRDVVWVRGGGRDVVSCGAGRDLVYADRADRVAPDCERVIRR